MSLRPQTLLLPALVLLTGGAVYLTINGAESRAGSSARPPVPVSDAPAPSAPAPSAAADASPTEPPLAAHQDELLRIAFDAASAIPHRPHIKNRSLAQEQVVDACLELGQADRAHRCADAIDNWRRGSAYADIAYFCAREGDGADVPEYVALAQGVVESLERGELISEFESPQAWRRDRIRAKIARTLFWLGKPEEAAKYESGIEDSEITHIASVKAQLLDPADFDRQIEALDGLVKAASLEQVRSALEASAGLYDRFYADVERRELVREKIEKNLDKVPAQVAMELQMQLAEHALEHSDRDTALELALAAKRTMDSVPWDAEYGVRLTAKLADLRWRAGDEEGAEDQAAVALALYDAGRETIVDMFRAESLRPLAEAYLTMGDAEHAAKVYRMAVEEGALNQNARPRALDLTATCCSMAVHGFEPDAELLARVRAVRAGLEDPW